MAMRLTDARTHERYIVDGNQAFAERDGRIHRKNVVDAQACERLVAAAASIAGNGESRLPGAVSADGAFVGGGLLNAVEMRELDGAGTAAARTLLQEHLSFFDREGTGQISLRDSYAGWRALGWPPGRALVQTLGAALLFGRHHGGTIVIAEIARVRPSGSTGVYASDGNLDREKLERLKDAYRAASSDGRPSVAQARQAVGVLGRIPSRQFESFYRVCTRMNGAPFVTVEQLQWLYDGSLLWRAGGSRPGDARGITRNRKDPSP